MWHQSLQDDNWQHTIAHMLRDVNFQNTFFTFFVPVYWRWQSKTSYTGWWPSCKETSITKLALLCYCFHQLSSFCPHQNYISHSSIALETAISHNVSPSQLQLKEFWHQLYCIKLVLSRCNAINPYTRWWRRLYQQNHYADVPNMTSYHNTLQQMHWTFRDIYTTGSLRQIYLFINEWNTFGDDGRVLSYYNYPP